VSRIDADAPADCSIVLVRLQRSYDRLYSFVLVRGSGTTNVVGTLAERMSSAAAHFTGQHTPVLQVGYVGASPREIWYINTASVKSIRRLTGNQWGCLRTGVCVMCSRLPVCVSSRAAAF